jgi:hypothetical protein
MSNKSIILLNAFPDKKIKSLGNKGLIQISSQSNLIDYQIRFFEKLYNNPEIVVVGGFDHKRLNKYITHNKKTYNSKVKLIDHDVDDSINIGKSIRVGLEKITNDSIVIYNCSTVLNYKLINKLKKHDESFIIAEQGIAGNVGCISQHHYALNCFYDLSDKIYDFIHLDQATLPMLHKIIESNYHFDKLYLFEILNLCINFGAKMRLVYIEEKQASNIDSINSIKSLKKYLKV